MGQCPDCGAWNTFVEERAPAAAGAARGRGGAGAKLLAVYADLLPDGVALDAAAPDPGRVAEILRG